MTRQDLSDRQTAWAIWRNHPVQCQIIAVAVTLETDTGDQFTIDLGDAKTEQSALLETEELEPAEIRN